MAQTDTIEQAVVVPRESVHDDTNEFVAVQSKKSKIQSRLWVLYKDNIYQSGLLRKVMAEVVATYMLVFVTCAAAAISASDSHRISQLGASVAGGLIVTVMIYSVGHISGAHMNPAVTIGFATFLRFPWKQVYGSFLPNQGQREKMSVEAIAQLWVPFYVLAQFTGAISAALTLRELLDPIERIGTTTPSGTDVKALVMEIVVTFNMMFITSAVATDAKAVGELAGLAVGSAVCITSIVAGPVSGGSMNPARTLGPAIASREYKGLWVYFLGPVTGTLLGSWFYKVIQLSERKPIINPSLSLKLRRMMSNNVVQADQDDKLELAVTSV